MSPVAAPTYDQSLFQDDIALGSPRAVRMLGYMPAYYWDDPTTRGYICALAREMDRLEAAARALRTGSFPATASIRTLLFYERLLGLTTIGLTVAQRQEDLVAHFRKRSVASRYNWAAALDAFIATPGGWSYAESPPYTVNLTSPVDPGGDRTPVITTFARAITPAHLLLVVNGAYGAFKVGIDHIGIDAL